MERERERERERESERERERERARARESESERERDDHSREHGLRGYRTLGGCPGVNVVPTLVIGWLPA